MGIVGVVGTADEGACFHVGETVNCIRPGRLVQADPTLLPHEVPPTPLVYAGTSGLSRCASCAVGSFSVKNVTAIGDFGSTICSLCAPGY